MRRRRKMTMMMRAGWVRATMTTQEVTSPTQRSAGPQPKISRYRQNKTQGSQSGTSQETPQNRPDRTAWTGPPRTAQSRPPAHTLCGGCGKLPPSAEASACKEASRWRHWAAAVAPPAGLMLTRTKTIFCCWSVSQEDG